MRRLFILVTLLTTAFVSVAQVGYDYSSLCTEPLDRGVVAVRQADGRVAVSWRTLRSDRKGEPFDVYRDGKKLNAEPLTRGGTFFIDEHPQEGDVTYEVRGGTPPVGSFTMKAGAPVGYLSVPLQRPQGGQVPGVVTMQRPRQGRGGGRSWRDTGVYTYSANDASVGDVDGDGQYEIFLKWEPSNARDNSHDGYTGNTLIDCYRLSGELLWRIDLGRNIRSGAHYTPFMVCDLDGDGRAELMVKTADGTRDGQGRVIGDSVADYRNRVGRILEGPEYISVFNGLTGAVMDTKPYVPARGNVRDWGDDRGNRSERYLAALGYMGAGLPKGKEGGAKSTLSAVFCRGYYTRSVLAAWDWDGKELTCRWVFDTNKDQWRDYAGQGNHNLRVADVDGDGLDEIVYGSMAVDHDGSGLYNTGMGHGDAIHLLPDSKDGRLYIWDCHENKRDGSELRDAATGKIIFQIKSKTDVGRCMAADIDPTNPGLEMWSTDSHGIRNMKGEVVSTAHDANDPQHDNNLIINGKYLPVNFGVWWDGDLLRELLDRSTVSKYDWEGKQIVVLQKFDAPFNNGTKSNPCLAADILGDWREEVIVRDSESTELRIYVTPIPTDYRIDCLMQDVPYRHSVATQNVGYNQPSEPGSYIGPDRTDYLK